MDKFRSMEVFVSVVETGSFTAASGDLNMSSVMVGKYIQQMEQHLSTRLLQRNTRRQNLTEAGSIFYENCKKVLEQVKWAESSVESLQAIPKGLLRISAPVTLGASLIAPLLVDYLRQYTEVNVELTLSNIRVDLIEDGYDMAIRIGSLGEVGMVAKPLVPYEMVICASPEYLSQNGFPLSPEELSKHHCLSHIVWDHHSGLIQSASSHDKLIWPNRCRFSSNDGYALRNAALNGAGLLLQPRILIADDLNNGRLVSVLEDYVPPARPINLVYLPDARRRPKLTSIVNYLCGILGETNK